MRKASVATPATSELHDAEQFKRFLGTLNERQRRHCVALEAMRLGWGGNTLMARLTGLHITTIGRGIRELRAGEPPDLKGRVRKPGGGRKRIEEQQLKIQAALRTVVEPETAGDPCSGKRWVRSSLRELARRLRKRGYSIGKDTVRRLLKKGGWRCAPV